MSSEDTDPFEAILRTKEIIKEWLVAIYRKEMEQTMMDLQFLQFTLRKTVQKNKQTVLWRLRHQNRKLCELHHLLITTLTN
jgi:hypothetical protein